MNNRNRASGPGNGLYYDNRTTPQTIPGNQAQNYQRPGFVANAGNRYPTSQAAQSPRQNQQYFHGNSPMESGSRTFPPPMPAGGINTNNHPPFPHHQMPNYTARPQLNQHFGTNKFYSTASGSGSFSTLQTQQLSNQPYMYQQVQFMPGNIQPGHRYVTPAAVPNHHNQPPAQQSFYTTPGGQPFVPQAMQAQYYNSETTGKKPAKMSAAITIRDPDTREDVTVTLLADAKSFSRPGNRNSSSQSSNNNNKAATKTDPQVAAMFATQVAQVAVSPTPPPQQVVSSDSGIVAGDSSSTGTMPSVSAGEVKSSPTSCSSNAATEEVVEKCETESLVDSAKKETSVTASDEAPVAEAAAVVEEPVAEETQQSAASGVVENSDNSQTADDVKVNPVVVDEVAAPSQDEDVPAAEQESSPSPAAPAVPQVVEEVTVAATEEKEVASPAPQPQTTASSKKEDVTEVVVEEPTQEAAPAASEVVQVSTPVVESQAVAEVAAPTPVEKPVTKSDESPAPAAPVVAAVEEAAAAPVVVEEPAVAAAPVAAATPEVPEEEEVVAEEEEVEDEEDEDEDSKVQYDRTFLMSLRHHPLSTVKPSGLDQNIPPEIMVNKSISSHHISNHNGMYRDGPPDFTPAFAVRDRDHSGGGGGRQQGGRDGGGRDGGGGGRYGRNMRQHQTQHSQKIFRRPDAELNKAKNAWKPNSKSAKVEISSDDKSTPTEELFRTIRAILNKLTPQKFTPLMNQVNALPIDNEERLRGVIELVFEKAIDEPNFSEAYANMCRAMSQRQVERIEGDGKESLEFRKLLLTRCQKEFEKDHANEAVIQNLRDKINAMDDKTAASVKNEANLVLKQQVTKQRRRMLGNIRFIGELYKLSMLTEKIMHSCIKVLLQKGSEEALECLCRLLTTIGGQLDNKKISNKNDHGTMMQNYFDRLTHIINEKKTSSRVRFMIQDVMDLRRRKWQLRAVQAVGPKTIEEIHADHKNEKEQALAKAAAALATAHSNAPKNRQQGGRHNSRNNQHNQSDDPAGWQKVTSQKSTRYDPNKMRKITASQGFNQSSQFDENNITFAPRGGRTWLARKSGSTSMTRSGSGGYSSSQRNNNNEQPSTARSSTPTMMNRFSALNSLPQHEQQQQQTPSSRMTSGSSNSNRNALRPTTDWNRFSALPADPNRPSSSDGMLQPDSVSSGGGRAASRDGGYRSRDAGPTTSMPNSMQSSKKEALDAARRITACNTSKSDSVPSNVTVSKPIEPKPAPKMSATDLERRHTGIVKEYLSLDSIKEALECYSELNQPAAGHDFVLTVVMHVLEKSVNDCEKVSALLCEMIETKAITCDAFMKGAKTIANECVDLEVDIPRIWTLLAAIVAPVIAGNADMTFAHLNEIAQAAVMDGEDKRLSLAVHVVARLRDILGMADTKKAFEKHVDWSCFSDDSAAVKRLLERHELTELEGTCCARGDGQQQKEDTPQTAYIKMLLGVITQRSCADDFKPNGAFDKIEAHYGPEVTKTNDFVRAVSIVYVWRSLLRISDTKEHLQTDDSYLLERLAASDVDACTSDEWILAEDWFKSNVLFLQKYVHSEEQELQTLYAMQHLFLKLSSPIQLLKLLFDQLYDVELITEVVFFQWEKNDDPAESFGKGVALNSARSFLHWLRLTDEEGIPVE